MAEPRQEWTQQYYPIAWLPYPARLEIAKYIDVGGPYYGIEMLASHLRYKPQDVEWMRERCRCREYLHSVTFLLFSELESIHNGPSIQDLYKILLAMRSAAADVILRYLPEIIRRNQRYIHTNNGQQNLEPSVCECGCERIQSRLSSSSQGSQFSTTTRSVQTSDHQNVQAPPQNPQNQPCFESRPNHSMLARQAVYPIQDSQQHSSNSDQKQCVSGSDRSSPDEHLKTHCPDYKRSTSLQENLHSWIEPDLDTSQLLSTWIQPDSETTPESTKIRNQSKKVSEVSQRSLLTRSISQPTHFSGTESDVLHQSFTSTRRENENSCRSAMFNCQECRMAADCDQTVLLKLYSEPNHSCALHANRLNSLEMIANQRGYTRHDNVDGVNPSHVIDIESQNGQETFCVEESVDSQTNRSFCVIDSKMYSHPKAIDHDETVPKKFCAPTCDSRFSTSIRQKSFQSDSNQTAKKTRFLDDREEETSCLDKPADKYTEQTAKKTAYFGEENTDCRIVYPSEVSNKSPCINNTRNQSHMNQSELCDLGQRETLGNMTDLSEKKSSSQIGKWIDGRHSWHAEPTSQRVSMITSLSDSSIGSWSSSSSSESGTKPVVLVTFSGRDDDDMQEILDLISWLRKAGIKVRVDMDIDHFFRKGLNRMDWLDKNLRHAKFVIACITPEYATDIIPSEGAEARVSHLNTRYIFDFMRKEYYDNQSQNRRLIPILFPNSGAQYSHVPQCMTATKIYTYSSDPRDKNMKEVLRLIKR